MNTSSKRYGSALLWSFALIFGAAPLAFGSGFYNAGTNNGGWDDVTTADWSTTTLGSYTNTWAGVSRGVATFEGTGGSVAVASGASAPTSVTGITFSTSGYTLSGGTINLSGTTPFVTNTANTANTTISSNLTGTGAWSKSGAGSLTISGATTLSSGALTFSNGKLVLSGTNTGTIGAISVANGGNAANGWLEVASGGNWTASSLAYSGVNSVMHQNAGTLATTGNFSVNGSGTSPFNAYYMSGGTLTVGNIMTVGNNSTSVMGFHMSGGSVTANGATVRIGGSVSNAAANMTVNGTGSFSTTQILAVGATGNNPLSHLAIGDTAQVTASNASGVVLGTTALLPAGVGTIHLSGGTLTTTTITRNGASNGGGTVLFNGGTLKVLSTGGPYTNLIDSLVTVNVNAGGATIDTNTNNATIQAPLLASGLANQGITSITVSSPGSNYSFPSTNFTNSGNMVTFTGGTGSGGSAAVTLDSNGGIAKVTVLTPGSYTVLPTGFTLVSSVAGPGNTAFSGVSISGASNTAGSLTKTGLGTLTLSSGVSTYTGATKINQGILSVSTLANGGTNSGIGASSNAAANLVLNGGTLQYTGGAVSTDRLFSVGTSNGTLQANGSGAVNFTNTGAIGFNSQSGARLLTLTGTNTGANTIAAVIGNNGGATSLTKVGAGQWVLSGNNTYTGNTNINQGTLALSNANNNNISGSPLITLVGGAFLDTTGLGGAVDLVLASGQTLTGTGTVTGNLTVGSGSTIAPGASPGTINNNGNEIWDVAGNYEWEINDAGAANPVPTGTAGNDPGWDLISITGSLTINATSGNPFVIELVGLTLANAVGTVNDFNPTASYAWMIADSGSNVIGYAADKFTFNDSQFAPSNPYTGTFGVVLGGAVGGDNTQVWITYTPAVEAVPEPGTLGLAVVGLAGLALVAWRRRV